MPKQYYIKTYGCQMNVNDSEILAGILEREGYVPAEKMGKADLILVNTCSIRAGAENKGLWFAHSIKSLKEKNPNLIIGLCGCVAQQEKENILKKMPFVDLVMGPQGIDEFAGLLKQIETTNDLRLTTNDKGYVTYFKEQACSTRKLPVKRAKSPRTYVSITFGCDNYCSYCVVPYVRGREVSRPMDEILAEIKALDKTIHKEVILLGQNVNAWVGGLANLLREVSAIAGVEWINFMTSHPKDLSDEIIAAMAELPQINHYLHLPVQSGSSKILKAMNRKYDRDYYLKLVEKIYSKIPDITLTSDLIVGFPGETEQDFKDSLSIIRHANFDSVNTLMFSPRPQTAAAALPDQIDGPTKNARLLAMMEVVENQALAKNQQLVGKTLDALVEGPAKDGRLSGRTRGNKIVYFDAPLELLYQIKPVKITSAKSWVLEGSISSGVG
ncbi:MAG: tRNA (N6-isopentenyl adenosine(37)-C2)-methylthiotransferase MiaB [Candidatus Margulisbacteria bacterium]|nr:tRNA (N6-isopentenyl adenosine(37)-C2)-methylthiotransferase MiaB [Candidatus Margulisiibacteriota bacterium]